MERTMESRSAEGAAEEPRSVLARVLAWFVVALVATFALWQAAASLDWRLELDSPLLHYMAFMVLEQDAALYRDVFVTSYPGAILFHVALLETIGPGDRAFQVFNLVWTGLLLVATVGVLRPFGLRAALGGASLFLLAYLHGGQSMVLQRDYVLLLPIALALWLHVSGRGAPLLRMFLIGVAFALAVSIKPHAGIGLPWLLAFEWKKQRERGTAPRLAPAGGACLVGFLLPLVPIGAWLAATGALGPFLEMSRRYLPMHIELSGDHEFLQGGQRWHYFLTSFFVFGRAGGFLVAGAVGLLAALQCGGLGPARRRLVMLLAGLAFLYSVYAALAGQFWPYHWMPYRYFVCALVALCLMPLPGLRGPLRLFPIGAALLSVFIVLPLSHDFVRQTTGFPTPRPSDGRADAIADWLREHAGPDDLVQPFDWASGGVHAMLMARARIATPYVSDYHFYHHEKDPYIQALRVDFIRRMGAARPRFLVEITARPRPHGKGTTPRFVALEALMKEHYAIAAEGKGWRIWARNP
jgi:hypothetical protein